MRRALPFCAFLFLACGGGGKSPAADSAAVAAVPSLSLADLTGKWTQSTTPEGSDTVVTTELNFTGDPSGWTMTVMGRPAAPTRVTVDGDSVMMTAGPFESVLRKGVQVTTNNVSRLVEGKLVGHTVAHYSGVASADSVRQLRTVATRTP